MKDLIGKKHLFYSFFIFTFLLLAIQCASSYAKVIGEAEKQFYRGNYEKAFPVVRSLAKESDSKDRLLFLMEAGIIRHTQGEYEESNKIFKEAEIIADNIKVSLSKTGLAFMLSDNESNFRGEDFERVLIKFYVALNYIFMGDYQSAKIYFRRVDIEMKDMTFVKPKYRQNFAARYLDAILSEALGRGLTDSLPQYNFISRHEPSLSHVRADSYVLGIKTKNSATINEHAGFAGQVNAYDQNMNPISYQPGMGEVVIIHQAGKSAIKESRGKLANDQFFALALRGSIQTAIHARGKGASAAGVITAMSRAENPIPVYKNRDPASALPRSVLVNGRNLGNTKIFNDYSDTAIQNFNDNYKMLVSRNVASIAVKVVAAYLASEAAAAAIQGDKKQNDLVSNIIRIGLGAASGYAAAKTISPDLRSWRLLPSNYQIKRFYLQPGTYTIEMPGARNIEGNSRMEVEIESGKIRFVNFRSYTPE